MERCVSQCTRSGSRFQQACLGRLWLCSTAAWNRKVKVLFFLTREASPFPRNVLSCFLCRNRVKVVSSTSVCVFFFRSSSGLQFFLGGSSCSQTGPGIIGDTARRERERGKSESNHRRAIQRRTMLFMHEHLLTGGPFCLFITPACRGCGRSPAALDPLETLQLRSS